MPTRWSGMEFNLVDDDWIPVVLTDGTSAEVSLRSVLTHAGRIRSLALDAPSQIPPVMRLLLAVLHRALQGPTSEKQWVSWWDAGAFDAMLVETYLDEHRSRFDLFDPQSPFMQVGGLEALNGKTKTAALLLPHIASGNNVPLFSAERDNRPAALSPAQAARWLLHAHAWDTAAIKTGAVGDGQAVKGKTLSNPVGSLGQLGVVMPMGPTLWHSLMCNLLPLTSSEAGGTDLPVWERPPLSAQWSERAPKGRLELFTWPARRIRLVPEPAPQVPGQFVVRQVVVCGGDRLSLETGQDLRAWMRSEPHSAWKRSPNLEKKRSFPLVYWPVRHQVERQLWRGLGPLLARAEPTTASAVRDAPTFQGPAALSQLGSRARMTALRGMPLHVLAVGFEYGNQSAVITEAYGDVLPLPVIVLSAQSDEWRHAVLDAVRATAAAVHALAKLAENLAVASGCRPSEEGLLAGHRERARETAYAALDAPFRRWLSSLAEGDADIDQALDLWANEARTIIRARSGTLLNAASPSAWHGHETEDGQVMDASLAEIYFHSALHKALHELLAPEDGPDDLEPPTP